MNWNKVIERDRALRASVEDASEALARHRYENTIGEGVAFREYARRSGVDVSTISRYVRAHEALISDQHLTISDALVKASTSAERAEVIEVVAEARGTSMKNVQAHHGDEVRRVRNIARERAEVKGTTVREEAETIARTAVRQERAETQRRTQRAQQADLRFIELERHLLAARRALRNALAVNVELDDDLKNHLTHAIDDVRELVDLINLRFVGAGDVDWDAELSRLGEAQ